MQLVPVNNDKFANTITDSRMAVPPVQLLYTKPPALQASRWFVKADQVASHKVTVSI